ncbi:sporulation protein YqfC [Sporanaerobium hydrogeniformans]|uniref:Sporulation protein YqfC n=1 Tax=Sporanaerobium hydrogeniformans TaxID=3072179 RepID=A0AC61DEW2_9FIRM|nr:YabP/YqfC family sporulation protein [Sporanaerobium hydrogeniformans]PHV71442.1 sporulation protein YqfC [Sporanaerobium hydrogeniformans]
MMKQAKSHKAKRNYNLREQFTEALEVPREVVSDLPVITLVGDKELNIENFSRLIEYTEEIMRLETKCGLLTIQGKALEAKSMTAEMLTIKGRIQVIHFSKL